MEIDISNLDIPLDVQACRYNLEIIFWQIDIWNLDTPRLTKQILFGFFLQIDIFNLAIPPDVIWKKVFFFENWYFQFGHSRSQQTDIIFCQIYISNLDT